MTDEGNEFLSVEDAAQELKITPRATRHRITAGTLIAHKLGKGTSPYVITRAEIERVKAAEAAAREGKSA